MACNDQSLGKFCAEEREWIWALAGKMLILTAFVILTAVVFLRWWCRNNYVTHVERNVESAVDGNTIRDDDSEPVHRVFLSHSGAQKDFVHQLFDDLERCERQPFFDKSWESLSKGKNFPKRIFKAIECCEAGVVVLSEDFMKSKWPMLELVAMTKNPKLEIIPVFLNISPEQIRDPKNQKRWSSMWRGWARDDKARINIEDWLGALRVLSKVNGLRNDGQGDVNFRKEIVAAVCKLVCPQIKWNDSHVQGRSRLCEIICKRIGEVQVSQKYGVCILGLYGVGGIGKTTICQALCNEYLVKMRGRVFHVELKSGSEEEWLALLQKALRALTNKSHDVLIGLDKSQCEELLKGEMQKQAVFLAIDNVCDSTGSIDRVQTFLSRRLHGESVVIVTSRSLEVLRWSSLNIDEGNCLEMPELEEEEAKLLFLQHATLDYEARKEVDDDVITLCVVRCRFQKGDGKGYHYHPLALKVLGGQLGYGRYDERRWVAQLKNLDTFNQLRVREHPIFSILRISFDSLLHVDQLLFMDVALFLPRRGFKQRWSAFEWLSMIHGMSVFEVMQGLEGLKRKSLLEELGDGYSKGIGMHDLWREFSKMETKVGDLDHRTWIYEEGEWSTLDESFPFGGCWQKVRKMCFLGKGLMSLKRLNLDYFSNVTGITVMCSKDKVLPLTLDLRKLKHLKSLEVNFEGSSDFEVLGLSMVENLRFLSINTLDSTNVDNIGHLTNLEVLHWESSMGNRLPDLNKLISLQAVSFIHIPHVPSILGLNSRLTSLRYLNLDSCYELDDLGLGFRDLVALEELHLRWCHKLEKVPNLQKLTKLEKLEILRCSRIRALLGLGELVALQHLHVENCLELEEVPSLQKLIKLEKLLIWDCSRIRTLPGLDELVVLQQLDVWDCPELKDIPNLCKLTKLEKLEISDCSRIEALHGVGELVVLQALKVYGFHRLKELSDLEKLTRLEKLEIHDCSRIKALLDLGKLVALQHLDVADCLELEVMDVQKLTKLKELVIWGCSRIRALPGLSELVALQRFDVGDCLELEEIPNLYKLTKLEKLEIWSCSRIRALLGLDELVALQYLSIRECLELEEVPDLHKLTKLEKLNIWRCSKISTLHGLGELVALQHLSTRDHPTLDEVPDLLKLTKLEKLKISGCSRIRAMPGVGELVGLQHLSAWECFELEELPNLQKLTKLAKLIIGGCSKIKALPGLGELVALEYLDAQDCSKLDEVPHLQKLTKLKKLKIGGSSQIRALLGLSELVALQHLDAGDCPQLEKVPNLHKLTKLEILEIDGCSKLKALLGLDELVALQHLDAGDCPQLEKVPNLHKLTKLEILEIDGCSKLKALLGLDELVALQHLDAGDCLELEEVSNLHKLTKLEKLEIWGCSRIRALFGMGELVALQHFDATGCYELEEVPNLHKLTKLEKLNISACSRIRALPGLGELVALRHLNARDCLELGEIPNLHKLTKLEKLKIGGCSRIRALPGIGELVSLRHLDAANCPKLGEVPNLHTLTKLEKVEI